MARDRARVDRAPARSASRPAAPHGHRDVHGEPVPGHVRGDRGARRAVATRWPTRGAACSGRARRDRRDRGRRPRGRDGDRAPVDARPRARRPATDDVPRDGERRRSRRVAAVVRGGAPRPTPAARDLRPQVAEPVLRRAARAPVADEPVPVRADVRLARRAAARRAGRTAARRRGAGRDPGRGAREQPGVDRRSTASPTHCSRTCSRSATSWSTSRRPSRAWPRIAARDGLDPWAVMYDLLLGADGREFLLRPLLNFGRGSYDGLHDMMLDPRPCRASVTAARTVASSATRA